MSHNFLKFLFLPNLAHLCKKGKQINDAMWIIVQNSHETNAMQTIL